MRNISFSLTTPQFNDRTKTVTRRMGWLHVKIGERLHGIEKGQGLQKGEKVKRFGIIEVVDVRREPIQRMTRDRVYGRAECVKEGFPHLTPEEFVEMFCRSHKGCVPSRTWVTRIEFRYT